MRKILVVEDEDVLRESYEIILSTQPYLVDVAKNGQEALDMCEQTDYDLILLDLMMPVLTGLGFMEKYKNPKTKIIILSNLSHGKELAQALRLGARSNIVKASLSPKELISSVRYEISS